MTERVWIVENKNPSGEWRPCVSLCYRTRKDAREQAGEARDHGKRNGYDVRFRVRAYVREEEAGR